jgi:hypothetical protein
VTIDDLARRVENALVGEAGPSRSRRERDQTPRA